MRKGAAGARAGTVGLRGRRAHFLQTAHKSGPAGRGFWPTKAPARAGGCALVGGYTRGEQRRQRSRGPQRRPRHLWLGWAPRVLSREPDGLGSSICVGASPFFANPIQNGFCGIGFLAHEPAGPCAALRPGRWVCEKGSLLRGRCQGLPWHASAAAFAGRPVPIPTLPPSRGALRSAGVPTIAAGTSPAARPDPPTTGGRRGIWEDSRGARDYPVCAEGWALWVLGGSPDLTEATGGTYRLGKPFGAEPPGRASSWGA